MLRVQGIKVDSDYLQMYSFVETQTYEMFVINIKLCKEFGNFKTCEMRYNTLTSKDKI